jgi:predicted nucleic acid-binding protein
MRVLLDTNIIIHREASKVINEEIGRLFYWMDKLNYKKYVHPVTIDELKKHLDPEVVKTMGIKVQSYHVLQSVTVISQNVKNVSVQFDKTENDRNDSLVLNELYNSRADFLITEDRKIIEKAALLNLKDKVFTIDSFLEKVVGENPSLIDYKVLSIKKELFGNIDVQSSFFDAFREEYYEFDKWFNKKSEEIAYICSYEGNIGAFLYVKIEDKTENYSEISPILPPKKRLKIGTFKTSIPGIHLGERFLKIVFDNALKQKVDEIYLTTFDKRASHKLLIGLITKFGFVEWGTKNTPTGKEQVFVKNFSRKFNRTDPKKTFPYLSKDSNVYIVSIYPEYHTELFPDSILNTESPLNFVENVPHRNAIVKEYVSHAIERGINKGDVLIFYRTGGLHKGVVTTLAIVDSLVDGFNSEKEFVDYCLKQKRTVFSEQQLKDYWNRFPKLKPFVVNLLYAYSLPKRPNLKTLMDLGIIRDFDQLHKGFVKISLDDLKVIIKEAKGDESIISN